MNVRTTVAASMANVKIACLPFALRPLPREADGHMRILDRLRDVRFGSQADILVLKCDVCFTPKRGTSLSAIVMSALCQMQTSTRSFDHFVGERKQ